MAEQLLKLRVTLKGRPVRAYSFKKECVTVGRSPESDVFLDNPGISRDHCKLEQTPSGLYLVHDLNSANGVFVNDVQVARQPLMNNDVLRVGKYSLWVTYEEDRRADNDASRRRSAGAVEGTMVLSSSEVREMIESAREAEAAPPPTVAASASATAAATAAAAAAVQPARPATSAVVLAVLFGFLVGYGVGNWVPASVWQAALSPVTAMVTPAGK